jgi:geranylgeranyl transferase type-2 subunit beta
LVDLASYLERLATRVSDGLTRIPPALRDRQIAYLQSAQNPDGGFSGREGGSDLYYTAFGLRGLAVLDALSPEICARAAGFLRTSLTQQATVVDFFSLLYACLLIQLGGAPDVLKGSPPDWPERVAATLETFRVVDGGYTRTPGGPSGSTYHSFLVALSYQLLGRPLPNPADIVRFVASRRRDDGGFVEIAPMRRSGINPTAAAIGLLQLVGAEGASLLNETREGVIDLLLESVSDEGGLRANGRVPLADLLSTFTGVWTLTELGAVGRLDVRAGQAFVTSVERPEGGFHGGLWDEGHDVEYTFYGLGALALLTP